jgi:hypothetical protein
MNIRLIARITIVIAATQSAVACNRFVWNEDPFTPDPAAVSETLVDGRDTTYVLKRSGYYLLASQRAALWNREVMDDVAWRYRALFGDTPEMIAIRLDSVATTDTATTWRGVPFARVAVRRRTADGREKPKNPRERDMQDSARVQLLAGPMLAATTAETWLKARALDAARGLDSQPGGPVRVTAGRGALPAWIEAGALRILGSGGAVDRANDELRADSKHIVPLASLFSVAWTVPPNALEVVHPGASRFGLDDAEDRREATARARERRDAAPGASPLFIAQATSLLGFLHDRDPGLLGRLADELTRGGSIPDVLASSRTLPHDVSGLDAAWRDWLKKSQRSRR